MLSRALKRVDKDPSHLIPTALKYISQLNSRITGPTSSLSSPRGVPGGIARLTEAAQMEPSKSSNLNEDPQVLEFKASFSVPATGTPFAGVKKTFYKRQLPTPPSVAFSSAEGKALFQEALQQGTMSGFFKLVEQYSTQDEPAFCGLASLAMVLNALSIDPRRTWKGSWRWFHEYMLDCCMPLEQVKQEGIVLAQTACLARCNGANVELKRCALVLASFAWLCNSATDTTVVIEYYRRCRCYVIDRLLPGCLSLLVPLAM